MDQAKDRGAFRVFSGARDGADPVDRDPPPAPVVVPPRRAEAAAAPRRASRGLAAIVARIREDAVVEPGRYLEECEVPGGGE